MNNKSPRKEIERDLNNSTKLVLHWVLEKQFRDQLSQNYNEIVLL